MALVYLAYLLSFADRVIFGMSLKPIKAALGFSDSQLGILAGAALSISYAVFSPIGGWMVDRLRRRATMVGAIFFFSVMTLLTGLARSLPAMALARVGVGIGESFISPLAVSLISDVVPRGRRARAFGLYLSAGAAGSLVAMLLGGLVVHLLTSSAGIYVPLLGRLAPWQGLFASAALLGLLLSAATLVLMPEPDRQPQIAPARDVHRFEDTRLFLRRYWRLIAAIFVGMSLFTLPGYTFTAWSLLFFERVHGWSAVRASLWMGATSGVTLIVGCLAAGPIIEAMRRTGRLDAPLRVGLAAGLLYATFCAAAVMVADPYVAIGLSAVAAFAGYVPPLCIYASIGDLIPAATRGRFTAVHTLVIGIVANAIGPLLVGVFNDHLFVGAGDLAIRYSLVTLFACAAVAGVLVTLPGLPSYKQRLAELSL